MAVTEREVINGCLNIENVSKRIVGLEDHQRLSKQYVRERMAVTEREVINGYINFDIVSNRIEVINGCHNIKYVRNRLT